MERMLSFMKCLFLIFLLLENVQKGIKIEMAPKESNFCNLWYPPSKQIINKIQIVSKVIKIQIVSCVLQLKDIGNQNFYCFIWKSMKNKPVGRLMLYSISSSSEVIRKNEQNINCWFSTTCDIISWVSMFIE